MRPKIAERTEAPLGRGAVLPPQRGQLLAFAYTDLGLADPQSYFGLGQIKVPGVI